MNSEPGPITFSLLGGFVAWLGPVLGPYALVAFAAGVGSLLVLSAQPADGTAPRWAGVKFILIGAALALLLTGPILWAVQVYTAIPANIALVPVAFVLGLARNKLIAFVNQVLDAAAAAVGAFLTAVANARGGK